METLGVVFCHAHGHRDIDARIKRLADRWILVDKSIADNPDVLGDILDRSTLEEILEISGDTPIKYVVFYACPIGRDSVLLTKFLIRANELLKYGGEVIVYNGINFIAVYYARWQRLPGGERTKDSIQRDFVRRVYNEDREAVNYLTCFLNVTSVDAKFNSWGLDGNDIVFIKN